MRAQWPYWRFPLAAFLAGALAGTAFVFLAAPDVPSTNLVERVAAWLCAPSFPILAPIYISAGGTQGKYFHMILWSIPLANGLSYLAIALSIRSIWRAIVRP